MSLLLTLNTTLEAAAIPLTNLQGWWDATNSDSITKDGSDLVSQVNDLSGQGNHATASGSLRPTWLASVDGTAAIRSNNKLMDTTNTINNVTAETIFALVRVDGVSSAAEFIMGVNGTSWGIFHATGTPDVMGWTTQNSTDTTGAIRNLQDINIGTQFKLFSFVRSVAENRIAVYENGLLVKQETHSVGDVTMTMQLGGRGSLRGDITWKEMLWYDRAMGDAERQRVEQLLMQKYGVGTVPAAFADAIPAVKRRAIAGNYTSSADFAKTSALVAYLGDSTAQGYAPKADFNANYVKLFTDGYLYEWNVANAWQTLDTRDAASHNNKGNNQANAGMEGVLAEELSADLSQDVYVMKYAISGSHLANVSAPDNWNVANDGNFWLRFRRYLQDAINEAVLEQNIELNATGLVIFLATNDANDPAEAGAVQSNMTALINAVRSIGCVPSDMPVAVCEIFSDSPTYTEINTVRTALVNVAANMQEVTHIDGMDATADTEDGTHPNAATYEAMGANIAMLFSS